MISVTTKQQIYQLIAENQNKLRESAILNSKSDGSESRS